MKAWIASLAGIALVACSVPAHAAAWTLGQWQLGSNGHYYSVQQITGNTTGWLIARTQAQALTDPLGGAVDLVTLTSSTENSFVFAGIDSAGYWSTDPAGGNEGPNIGGFQTDKLAEPAGHWAWVTGEAYSYTQWSSGEPNNSSGIEDYMTFYGLGTNRTGNWNDISSSTSAVGAAGAVDFYVAESVTPEPASLMLLIAGATITLSRHRRKNC